MYRCSQLKWVIRFGLSILVVLPVLLAGCANSISRPDSGFEPTYPVAMPAPVQNNGAIFQSGHEVRLFEDTKAFRIGDIITITLVEKTNASKKNTTSTRKDNAIDITNPTVFGSNPLVNIPGILPLASNQGNGLGSNLASSQAFTGEGSSTQSNSLEGDVTVTVADILANGNLVVRGEKWITINQGDEYVRISGIVRPIDIGSNNSVASNRVANARITYSGKGALADSNSPGWMARFFLSVIWPF